MEKKIIDSPKTNEPTKEDLFKRLYAKCFIFIIIILISFEYYFYVFDVFLNTLKNSNFLINLSFLTLFHLLLVMMLWCLIVTMTTNPGEIPLYWGFHIGDQESKRKRYCLICNAFKPERSHHCSICNICILNMDHHCPWVSNCIGFYNRKFFMQLLFYLLLLTLYIDMTTFTNTYTILLNLYTLKFKYSVAITKLSSLVAFTVNFILSILVFFFFKFHLTLVLYNITTIESLDPLVWHENKFGLSKYQNWIQVFGDNKIFWFIPIYRESGLPIGDGLTWRTNLPPTLQEDFSSANKPTEPKVNKISNNNNIAINGGSPKSNKTKSSGRRKTPLPKSMIHPINHEVVSSNSVQIIEKYMNNEIQKKPNVDYNNPINYESNKSSRINAYASTKDYGFVFSPTSNSNNIHPNVINRSNEFDINRA